MLLLYLVAVVGVARARADSLPCTQLCHRQLGKEACRTAEQAAGLPDKTHAVLRPGNTTEAQRWPFQAGGNIGTNISESCLAKRPQSIITRCCQEGSLTIHAADRTEEAAPEAPLKECAADNCPRCDQQQQPAGQVGGLRQVPHLLQGGRLRAHSCGGLGFRMWVRSL